MSTSPPASALPATPDNQAAAQGGAGGDETMASPMPPPPPFNTPAGAAGSSGVPVGLGPAGGGIEAVAGDALATMLSGVSIGGDDASGGQPRPASAARPEDEGGDGDGMEEEDDEDEEEVMERGTEEDETEVVELPPEVMKRLYQLKALQSEKDVVYERYKVKRAELEMEFAREYGAIFERRAEVVAGRARDLDESEEASASGQGEGEGEVGVPHFWMQCMLHHEALHDVVCEPDLEALYYLSDVRCVDKENLLGFTLEFHFDDNPYFTNAVLTKRYDTANIMDQGEPLLEGVEGTPIDWKAGRNLCERTTRRKVKRGGQGGETRTITKVEKTESFFKFFQNPVMYDEDDEDDEDDEQYNFSFDMDYEVARIFRNHLIPNAVLWFTGEAVDDEEEESDEETDEEEDLEEAEEISAEEEGAAHEDSEDEAAGDGDGDENQGPVKQLNFKAPAGFGAPPSGSTDGKECKQS